LIVYFTGDCLKLSITRFPDAVQRETVRR